MTRGVQGPERVGAQTSTVAVSAGTNYGIDSPPGSGASDTPLHRFETMPRRTDR